MLNSNNIARYYVALLLVCATWSGAFFVGFLTDDYQIIQAHNVHNTSDVCSALWSPYVLSAYWRPLGSISFSVVQWISPWSSFLHHACSVGIYACVILALFTFLRNLFQPTIAFLLSALFAVVPSHELHVLWLSCRGDTMSVFFLLLAAHHCYKAIHSTNAQKARWLLLAVLFVAACLSKESAFAGVGIPILLLLLAPTTKQTTQKSITATLGALAIVALVLAYRNLVIGGTPFSSGNFAHWSVGSVLQSYVLYIPVSFIPTHVLESISVFVQYNRIVVVAVGVLFFFGALWLLRLKKYQQSLQQTLLQFVQGNKKLLLFGVLWYSILIAPATLLFMRWYMFGASIGLFILLGVFLTALQQHTKSRTVWVVVLVVFTLSISVNILQQREWQKASRIMQSVVASIPQTKIQTADTSLALAIPDKFGSVNLMKLGVEETFEYALQTPCTIDSPLRVLLPSSNATECIRATRNSDTILLHASNGVRFYPMQHPTRLHPNSNEQIHTTTETCSIDIHNLPPQGESVARVVIRKPYKHVVFFNGVAIKQL